MPFHCSTPVVQDTPLLFYDLVRLLLCGFICMSDSSLFISCSVFSRAGTWHLPRVMLLSQEKCGRILHYTVFHCPPCLCSPLWSLNSIPQCFLVKVVLTWFVSLLVKMLLPYFCQMDPVSPQQSLFLKQVLVVIKVHTLPATSATHHHGDIQGASAPTWPFPFISRPREYTSWASMPFILAPGTLWSLLAHSRSLWTVSLEPIWMNSKG